MKEPITMQQAIELGHEALTKPYTTDEEWMFRRAIGPIIAKGVEYSIVMTRYGREIWLKDMLREQRRGR